MNSLQNLVAAQVKASQAAAAPVVAGQAFTQRILCLSTAHVPEETSHALFDDEDFSEETIHDILSIDPLEHGWLIWISSDKNIGEANEQTVDEHGHAELAALLKLARENGFTYLKLDSDGPTLPAELGFPTFEW